MNKLYSIFCLLFLSISCSPESDPAPKETPTSLNVQLSPSTLTPQVDEMAVVEVESDNPLREVKWIGEGFTQSISAFDSGSLGSSLEVYFQFPRLGIFPVNLELTGTNGKVVQKQVTFDVRRGNSVQITGIEVHNFYNKGKTWDPEFAQDNPGRLADLVFGLEKRMGVSFGKPQSFNGTWHISEIHENESSFTWDLSEENLYLDPRAPFHFGLADADEGNIGQDLMLEYPSGAIDLRPNMEEKPASLNLDVESTGLKVTFYIDWP